MRATLLGIPTKVVARCVVHGGVASLIAALGFYWAQPGLWPTVLKTLIFWVALTAVGLACLSYAYRKAARTNADPNV